MTTPEQVHAMSDDELRVKIAEARGWRVDAIPSSGDYACITQLIDPDGNIVQTAVLERSLAYFANPGGYLPYWNRDLNLAAELTEYAQSKGAGFEVCDALHGTEKPFWDYECIIYDPVGPACRKYKATAATEPRARSEAFYKWWLETQS
jgi:hypothetical protein